MSTISTQNNDWLVRRVTITNRRGVHARAAIKVTKEAAEYDCEIRIGRQVRSAEAANVYLAKGIAADSARVGEICGRFFVSVDCLDVLDQMWLAAGPGTTLYLLITGKKAEEAMCAVGRVIESRFEEGSLSS